MRGPKDLLDCIGGWSSWVWHCRSLSVVIRHVGRSDEEALAASIEVLLSLTWQASD